MSQKNIQVIILKIGMFILLIYHFMMMEYFTLEFIMGVMIIVMMIEK